jgi:putative transposase
MPRSHRLDLPGIPQHLIQRGNDRQACFFKEADYLRYLIDLRELAVREDCAVHAYVLMTNHVHLLLTPESRGATARLMQSLGGRYVRYINFRYERTGTLWEGRYKACLVDSGSYLLHCHRYIELNPLRAGMVVDPAEYRWSSHRHNARGAPNSLLTAHADYLALGSNDDERRRVYRQWAMAAVDSDEVAAIRQQTQRQHAYGTEGFRANIEAALGRKVGPKKIGRPGKPQSPTAK